MSNKYFFHADIAKYSERLRHLLIIVSVPIIALCVFCTIQIVLNYRSEFALILLGVICGSILLGMIFAFSAVYITEKHRRRHARYTFFDFLPSGMVYSEYAGEFVRYGERIILRRLYYIPFEAFGNVSRAKKSPYDITFRGEIRAYFFESGRLGYHVTEDGVLEFDTEVLNWGMYDTLTELTVKNRFGNTKPLERSVQYFFEQYKSIPEKKPFNISEYVAVRRKAKLTTSNPALEAPSYSRNWK